MDINFIYNQREILNSARIVQSFTDDLKHSGMFCVIPPEFLTDNSELKRDIKICEKRIKPLEIKRQLEKKWRMQGGNIIDTLKDYASTHCIHLHNEYKCVLTFYGPYGYYEMPDIIYLNISKGSYEFMLETILHELLHLALEKELVNKSALEREDKIDKVFIELFGDIFPDYHVQNNSN